jgi:Cyclic nucleotide-binding domain
VTRGHSESLGLQRDDDTDDVRWALQTAAVQMNRGGIGDAVTWIHRAAEAAEKAGNEWRALELRAHARSLMVMRGSNAPPASRRSSIPVDVMVEEVEIDELLEDSQLPPPVVAQNPFFAQSAPRIPPPMQQPPPVPPGLFAPRMPPPLPGYHVPAVQPLPWGGPGSVPQPMPGAPAGSGGVPFAAPPPSARGEFMHSAPASSHPPNGGYGEPVSRPRPSPIPVGMPSSRPGSLAQKTHIAFPAAGRLRMPSAPTLGIAGTSSYPPPLPFDAFTASGSPRTTFNQIPSRRPMASAPDLEVNEVDLDEGGDLESVIAASRGRSDRASFDDRLSSVHVETTSAEAVIAQLDSTLEARYSDLPPSQDLSHLFAEEEVLDDDSGLDRLSELTLDAGEFAAPDAPAMPAADRTGFENDPSLEAGPVSSTSGRWLTSGAPSHPAPSASSPTTPAPSASAWLTPSSSGGYPLQSQPPPSHNAPPSVNPASVPPPSVPPPSFGARHDSVRPGIASFDSVPPSPFLPSPSSVRPASIPPPPASVTPQASSSPTATSSSSPPPFVRPSSSSRPPGHPRRSPTQLSPAPRAEANDSSRPTATSVRPKRTESVLRFAQALTASVPPGAPSSRPPESEAPDSSGALTQSPPGRAASRTSVALGQAPASVRAHVDGVALGETRGFEDLPEAVQQALAGSVRVETLGEGEEVAFFGAAIVTFGAVDILPAISDEAGAIAHQGEVVFTIGTLPDSMPLRVVAKLEGTRVAVWDRETLNQAIAECSWVHEELHNIADRFLACCGATLGALGERLDDSLRGSVYSRLDVRAYEAGEVLARAGEAVPRLFIVGGGKLELLDAHGQLHDELSSGDFVFPSSILSAAPAPYTARAGSGGVLVLQASRAVSHELMMSVPPLLEILAG